MPGMSQSTYKALQLIDTFPEEERELGREIYFQFEMISIWSMSHLVAALMAGVAGFVLAIYVVSGQIPIVIPIAFGFLCMFATYRIVKSVVEKSKAKNVERIRTEIRAVDFGQSVLAKLREHDEFIEYMAEKHYL